MPPFESSAGSRLAALEWHFESFAFVYVQQLYRILAFFVLAVVLGLVARTYQRFK